MSFPQQRDRNDLSYKHIVTPYIRPHFVYGLLVGEEVLHHKTRSRRCCCL